MDLPDWFEGKKMTKILKERWMRLAGVLQEKTEPNPGEDRLKDAKHYVRNAMEALQTAIEKGLDEDQEMAKEIEGQLSTAYKKLTGAEESDRKNIGEAQFAKDALEDIETLWQPKPGEDYELGVDYQQPPTMIGSVQDEEFSLDDFDPEDEGLTIREPGYEADPEYDEDQLGDLYGSTWEEEEERTHWGEPVFRDTDIGRKSDFIKRKSDFIKSEDATQAEDKQWSKSDLQYAAQYFWTSVNRRGNDYEDALNFASNNFDIPKDVLEKAYDDFEKEYDTMYIF